MLAAASTSAVFLASYLTYHALVGSVRFTGQGPVRTLYFTILGTHTLFAIAIVPLATFAFARRHRRRWFQWNFAHALATSM